MSRAAFTSACGDPFILLLCIKMFQERFYNQVDRYYININNHAGVPKSVIAELLSKLSYDPKIHIVYHPRGIGNGPPLTELTLIAKEDIILFIEDDFFIFKEDEVGRCFQQIESDLTDVVGSPRSSCGVEVSEAAKQKYGLDYSGYGDQGPWFWPTGFFVKRKHLLRTDLDFGSHTWLSGQFSPELNHTFKEINHGDTAVWMCVQLRHLGLRFQTIPQHKADPFELQSKKTDTMNFHPSQQPFEWIHGGSLSSGWGGYLSGRIPDVTADISKQEIETRVAFWKICSDVIEGFDQFKQEYRRGIELLIENAKLDRERIDQKIVLYKNLMKI